eukprot:236334_1
MKRKQSNDDQHAKGPPVKKMKLSIQPTQARFTHCNAAPIYPHSAKEKHYILWHIKARHLKQIIKHQSIPLSTAQKFIPTQQYINSIGGGNLHLIIGCFEQRSIKVVATLYKVHRLKIEYVLDLPYACVSQIYEHNASVLTMNKQIITKDSADKIMDQIKSVLLHRKYHGASIVEEPIIINRSIVIPTTRCTHSPVHYCSPLEIRRVLRMKQDYQEYCTKCVRSDGSGTNDIDMMESPSLSTNQNEKQSERHVADYRRVDLNDSTVYDDEFYGSNHRYCSDDGYERNNGYSHDRNHQLSYGTNRYSRDDRHERNRRYSHDRNPSSYGMNANNRRHNHVRRNSNRNYANRY